MNSGSWKVDFEPVGLRGRCGAGLSLLDCARHLGVDLVNLCGGAGTCGRCIVKIVEGRVSPPTDTEKSVLPAERIAGGCRLACETVPLSDLKVAVPPESLTTPQRTQVESMESPVVPEPVVGLADVSVPPPGSDDLRSDCRRLCDALHQKYGMEDTFVAPEALGNLPAGLRDSDWRVRAVLRDREIIGLARQNIPLLGLAVDIGTTKIAAYLVDLDTGRTLAAKGAMNPQIGYGEDIVARFVYAQASAPNSDRMQRILVDALNTTADDLCSRVGASVSDVLDVVVVCNTAIHHLFLNLSTVSLSRAPYVPVVDAALDLKAAVLGLKTAPGAYVHLLPNIAGYVGADHVAMLMAVDILRQEGICLALDIGTNTEICLVHRGRMKTLSCASGPAFEGAHIQCGMRAADGAIERLRIENNRIIHQTIGGKPARGICGSGILDAFAEMYKAGVIEKNGRMNSGHPLVRDNRGVKEILLSDKTPDNTETAEITFSQKDVREIQLAKGAIRTGIEALLRAHDVIAGDIDRVIISGAFGTYIDVASAKTVGMLPNIPSDRFVQVGNAAGLGSRLALISRSKRIEAVRIARRVEYVELATFSDFSLLFAESMHLESP